MDATAPLTLHSDHLSVDVVAHKGADIVSIVDVDSGIDVLFRTPWRRKALVSPPPGGDSQLDWLARYPGGWQQLLPNAGAPRLVDGVLRGYHGEAAVAAWTVESATSSSASFGVDLVTAPLRLTRSLRVEGPALLVSDTVHNNSPDPIEVMWVQHPGFGAPFIDEHCTLTAGARSIISDAEAPGNVLPADARMPFPVASSEDGREFDLRAVPAPGSGRAVFAALTDFESGWFAIDSPSAGFGIRMDWDAQVFPHAWFWQECHASTGFPWFRRAYVIAVEPANVLPGSPSAACPDRGQCPVLVAGGSWTTQMCLRRTACST